PRLVLRLEPERDAARPAAEAREQGGTHGLDAPRDVHAVRRQGLQGVQGRVPGHGSGAVPGRLSEAGYVALAAGVAGAAEDDLAGVNRVPEACRDPAQPLFEPLVLEAFDLAAVAADEVVVMMTVGARGLEAGDPVPEVDPRQQALGGEQVEDAVHAGDADARPGGADAVVRLLRRQAAVLTLEVLDHDPAGAAAAVARATEAFERVLGPLSRARHDRE